MFLDCLAIFIFGLLVGSFLNVVILRTKKEEGFIKGRSKCLQCGHQLSWWENIPILSFVFLVGKCRECKKQINWQYPLVEFTTGILFFLAYRVVLISNLGLQAAIVELLFYWGVIAFLVIIFVYDLKYMIIPDRFVVSGVVFVFIMQVINFLIKYGVEDMQRLIYFLSQLVISGIIISGFFYIQYFVSKGKWIGGGDVTFGFLMGIILGWPYGVMALMTSYVLGMIVVLPLLLFKKKDMASEIPFGTFLSVMSVVFVMVGDKILQIYLKMLGL
jgi:prepilin signal peptidase PulO-like enzyme (type II secretory pathway)